MKGRLAMEKATLENTVPGSILQVGPGSTWEGAFVTADVLQDWGCVVTLYLVPTPACDVRGYVSTALNWRHLKSTGGKVDMP